MLNAMVQNSWPEAERFTRKLIKHSGPSVGLVYNLALITFGAGKMEDAYTQLLGAIQTYGESLRLCRLLADIAYLSGKRQDAIDWYAKAQKEVISSKEKKFIVLRMDILANAELYDRVLDVLSRMQTAHDAMTKNLDIAYEQYCSIVEIDPTQIEALNNLGVLELEHYHRKEQAIQYFIRVLELVDHQGAARNLAKAKKS